MSNKELVQLYQEGNKSTYNKPVDSIKRLEKILSNYTFNCALVKNIGLEIENINLSDNTDLKEINRLNDLKYHKEIQLQNISNALEALSENERKLIELRYFKKLRINDIAVQLEISENYCSTLKSKIIKKLVPLIFHNNESV